jgi:very-short-patch-repair endonuclease
MRLEPTQAERVLWREVRHGGLCGVPIRRQHPIDRFILDFYCASRKLAIELDGEIHDAQQDQDAERTLMLSTRGIRVIRFRNEEVLNHLESVLQRLRAEICPPRTAVGP